ncbi:MAG: hypothetical protein ABI867_41700 [Kofleriaceae bacterium]
MRLAVRVVAIAALVGWAGTASADGANRRRRTGTRVAYVGLTSTLAGIALGAFAIGLGNDRPDAAKPFYAASAITLGGGSIALATGLTLRATSPQDPPDAISLDQVRARHRNERRAGIAIGGVGASILITGIAHAIGAWRDNQLAQDQCPDGLCSVNGARLFQRAHTLSHAADLLVGMGAVGLAGGIILYRGGRDTGTRLVPLAGANQVGAAAIGHF